MIQFTLKAECKNQHLDENNTTAVTAILTSVPEISGVITTGVGESPFGVQQFVQVNLGAGPAGDAIAVGRKYRVTIEEVAE